MQSVVFYLSATNGPQGSKMQATRDLDRCKMICQSLTRASRKPLERTSCLKHEDGDLSTSVLRAQLERKLDK